MPYPADDRSINTVFTEADFLRPGSLWLETNLMCAVCGRYLAADKPWTITVGEQATAEIVHVDCVVAPENWKLCLPPPPYRL